MRANLHVCAKKLLLSLSVCAAMIAPNAGEDNAMRNVFNGMMTTKSPASFETATRTGVVGGSFSYRTTNVNTNLVSMSLPKASVGCNGIDVFLGSFSMIKGDQLVQVLDLLLQVQTKAINDVRISDDELRIISYIGIPTILDSLQTFEAPEGYAYIQDISAIAATLKYAIQKARGG